MQHISTLESKRKALIRDIHNISTDGLKKRIRSEIICKRNKEDLTELIHKTTKHITIQQFNLLVNYANHQFPHAIAHLGNLLLDGVIKPAQFERNELKVGYHPYWLRLIQIMVEQEYCTLNLLEHCQQSISPMRSESTVGTALSILYKIASSNLHSPIFFREEKTVLSILNAAMRSDSASNVAFLLILQLARRGNEELKERLSMKPLRQKIIEVMIQGSLKEEEKIQLLMCKTLKELQNKGLYFQEMNQTVLQMIKETDESSIHEILLSYIHQLIQKSPVSHLETLLNIGFIIILFDLKKRFQNEGQQQLVDKIVKIGRELQIRSTEMGYLQRGICHELQRYNLLGLSSELQLC